MPELPEVETVVRGLQKVLPGRRIVEVRLGKTDFIEDPATLEAQLPGRLITAVRRYGKFLVVDLDSPDVSSPQPALLVHLGMTGQLTMSTPDTSIAPHTHAFFTLDDGRQLRYRDPRRFGSMQMAVAEGNRSPLGTLGIDPLEASGTEFLAQLRGRRAKIKALLLDQTVLRGMGNIYTDESLWRARIHPQRLAAKLKETDLRRLYGAVQTILKEAIRLRGSSISDYLDCSGQRGEFQLRHRVYDREGHTCVRCKTVIRRVIVAGRSSYFCPHCQSAPRVRKA
ncbi:MAG: bifunctional DNA-formamidopyrimidine glycosylase/DNA-(apurinic or apyrimidinic site) lyase [Candidatus Acidiferrales bacterium]|jgi:formamidopyrimidine-DNA glycosylase